MENGRIVLEGSVQALRENSDIQEFYLGLNEVGSRKSYRDVKHYKRRKRWLSKLEKRRASPAIVLAAGRSTRMGAANKLLAEIDGTPMVRPVVEAALASRGAASAGGDWPPGRRGTDGAGGARCHARRQSGLRDRV